MDLSGGQLSLARIQDLAGKTVGITYGGNDETIMRALLATAGLDEQKVRLASVRYDYTPFFQKKIPIWPVYRNTQGIFCRTSWSPAASGWLFSIRPNMEFGSWPTAW
jgi:hypothetical protein